MPELNCLDKMGYDLHITRRKNWIDEGDDITKEEFIRLIRSDPEFTYPSPLGADYAEWQSPKSKYRSWLCWSDGRLQTKNPEPEFIDKMVAVARSLGAKVQGDENEVYLSSSQIQNETAQPPAVPVQISAQSRRKPLVVAIFLGCALLALKLIAFRRRRVRSDN